MEKEEPKQLKLNTEYSSDHFQEHRKKLQKVLDARERIKESKRKVDDFQIEDLTQEERINNIKLERAQREKAIVTTDSHGKLLIGKNSKVKNILPDQNTDIAYKINISSNSHKNNKNKVSNIREKVMRKGRAKSTPPLLEQLKYDSNVSDPAESDYERKTSSIRYKFDPKMHRKPMFFKRESVEHLQNLETMLNSKIRMGKYDKNRQKYVYTSENKDIQHKKLSKKEYALLWDSQRQRYKSERLTEKLNSQHPQVIKTILELMYILETQTAD